MRFKNPEGQLAHWFEALSQYDIAIKFQADRLNSNADALSRIPCDNCAPCLKQDEQRNNVKNNQQEPVRKMILWLEAQTENNDDVEDSPVSSSWLTAKTPGSLRAEQLNDPSIRLALKWKDKSQSRPNWEDVSHLGPNSKYYWSQWERLKTINGVLYREWHDVKDGFLRLQLVLLEIWRDEVMSLLHDNICAGHLGIHRTIARVRNRFYLVGYTQDIINKCNT